MKTVLVAGTNSWDNDADIDWFHPGHAFPRFLEKNGVEVLSDGSMPFIWSTDLDGVLGDRKNHVDWAAGGAALSYFVRMHDCPEVNVIAHSHGLQVVLYAAAKHGIQIDRLVSLGSPIRKDVESTARLARPNIKKWLHIYSDKSDRWQWLGELFDGKLGIVRKHPLADRNECVPKIGHSEILRNPDRYNLWLEKGWIDFLKGE